MRNHVGRDMTKGVRDAVASASRPWQFCFHARASPKACVAHITPSLFDFFPLSFVFSAHASHPKPLE
jgi:hypothetical protein